MLKEKHVVSIKSSYSWAKCKAKSEAEYGNKSQRMGAYFSLHNILAMTASLCKEVFGVS